MNETIYFVEKSYGEVSVCRLEVASKPKRKTYTIVSHSTVFGSRMFWRSQINKNDKGVFKSLRDAMMYARKLLQEYVDRQQYNLDRTKEHLTEINALINAAEMGWVEHSGSWLS